MDENEYTVSWEMETSVHAKDEWDAAKQAHVIVADPNNTSLHFRVLHMISGREFLLDLDTGIVLDESS